MLGERKEQRARRSRIFFFVIGDLYELERRDDDDDDDDVVVVVSNGSVDQVENALKEFSVSHGRIAMVSEIVHLYSFPELICFLERTEEKKSAQIAFEGEVVFMFFKGLNFIQDLTCDVMDFQRTLPGDWATRTYQAYRLCKVYFYFDATVVDFPGERSGNSFEDSHQFNSIMTIATDVIRKLCFMMQRIGGVFLDDRNLSGGKAIALRHFLRNFPNVEKLDLWSSAVDLKTLTEHKSIRSYLPSCNMITGYTSN